MFTFFDIPCQTALRAWSPNTWKVRFYLNYHRIPYRTQWIELPLIEATCVSLGIPASKEHADGRKVYTLPAIYDPARDRYVSESARIIRYLDAHPLKQSTRTPAFPKGTDVLQAAFLSAWTSKVIVPLWSVITPDIARSLNEESREYFERTRKGVFGRSLEELDGDLEVKEKSWEKAKKGLGDVDRWFIKGDSDLDSERGEGLRGGERATEGEDIFVMGVEPVFSDFVIAATFAYMRNVWGEAHPRWTEVAKLNDGRWARFVDALREYEAVN